MAYIYNDQSAGDRALSSKINALAVAAGKKTDVALLPVTPPTYTVFKHGGLFHYRDGYSGEVSTGNADAYTVIQAAVNLMTAGGKLLVKQGTYPLTAPITVPVKPLIICGEGPGTIFSLSTAITGFELNPTGAFSPFDVDQFTTLRDFSIFSSEETTPHYGILVQNRHSLIIDSVYFYGDSTSNKMHGLYILGLNNSKITRNHFVRTYTGIYATLGLGDFDDVAIVANDISYILYRGIYLPSNASKVIISANNIEECVDVGIVAHGKNHTIVANTITETKTMQGVGLGTIQDSVVVGNIIADNGMDVANTKDGIKCDQATRCVIANNQIGDLYGSGYQRYAISLAGACSNNMIIGNTFYGNATAPILDGGTGTIIRNNSGFITENSGSDAVISGQTAKVVTHGCDFTPAAHDVVITQTATTTNPSYITYVDTFTATEFTVHVSADPGASTFAFDWAVRKV